MILRLNTCSTVSYVSNHAQELQLSTAHNWYPLETTEMDLSSFHECHTTRQLESMKPAPPPKSRYLRKSDGVMCLLNPSYASRISVKGRLFLCCEKRGIPVRRYTLNPVPPVNTLNPVSANRGSLGSSSLITHEWPLPDA